MPPINFKETHSSQIPALETLIKLGYTYLPPEQALRERGEKTSQVLLPDILSSSCTGSIKSKPAITAGWISAPKISGLPSANSPK